MTSRAAGPGASTAEAGTVDPRLTTAGTGLLSLFLAHCGW